MVSVPEDERAADGTTTVFDDSVNSVRIEVTSRATAADVASARATDVPQLQASVPGFTLRDVRSVQRKGGTAVLIAYDANSAVDPVTGEAVRASVERYTFWQGGRQAVLTLTSPDGCGQRRPWRIVSDFLRSHA